MAMECGRLYFSRCSVAHFCDSVYFTHHVVEQKAAAGWAGGRVLPPEDPQAAYRADPGGFLSAVWRIKPGVLLYGAYASGRGGAPE